MSQQNTEKKLYDLLTTRDFDNFEVFDSKTSKPPVDPTTGQEDVSAANMYKFDWTSSTGHNYGTAVILLTTEGGLEIYFGDNLGRSMDAEDKSEWYDFLHQLKNFATKNFKSFSPKNLNQLRYTMQGQAAIKEGLFESWTGTRTQSWNGKQTEARLMIKHKRPLGETDARFRYIDSLFVETADGERFKLPFTKLSGGRAMLEHIRQGGRPYDARGQHITEMVNELNVLSRFRRANQGKIFEGDTASLVEQTNAYYETAQKTLKAMSHSRGYRSYFESWSPNEITEEEVVIEGLKHLFVTQAIDQRIEEALPILARIQQQENTMKEADIFESWASSLMEGTWALPDTPEQQAKLVELLSTPLPVGADATNATEQLYDLLGDDELFDQLEELAEKDPNADCRQVVMDRMQMLSDHPEIQEVIARVQIDDTAVMNPPAGTDAGMSANPDDAQIPANEGSTQIGDIISCPGDIRGEIIADEGDRWVVRDLDSEFEDDQLEFRKSDCENYVDETVKDPATQTEDPAGTEQPEYPEYQDNLADILKAAGVDDTVIAAPDYEEETNEDLDADGVMMTRPTNCSSESAEPKGTPLQGQYGHSGKLEPIGESPEFLTRLKELAGMIRN